MLYYQCQSRQQNYQHRQRSFRPQLLIGSMHAAPTHNGTHGTGLVPSNISHNQPAQLTKFDPSTLRTMNFRQSIGMNNSSAFDAMPGREHDDKITGIRILSNYVGGRLEDHLTNFGKIRAGHFKNSPSNFHYGQKFIDEANNEELAQNGEGGNEGDDDDDEEWEEASGEEETRPSPLKTKGTAKRYSSLKGHPLTSQGTAKRRIRFKQTGKVKGLFTRNRIFGKKRTFNFGKWSLHAY